MQFISFAISLQSICINFFLLLKMSFKDVEISHKTHKIKILLVPVKKVKLGLLAV